MEAAGTGAQKVKNRWTDAESPAKKKRLDSEVETPTSRFGPRKFKQPELRPVPKSNAEHVATHRRFHEESDAKSRFGPRKFKQPELRPVPKTNAQYVAIHRSKKRKSDAVEPLEEDKIF